MTETEKIIKEQFAKLPADIQKAIGSINLRETLQEVVVKNHLHIDQGNTLQTNTLLVLLGLEPLVDYVQSLEKDLGISSEQANAVAADVNRLIFSSIRDSLHKISQEIKEQEEIALEVTSPGEGVANNSQEETEDLNKEDILAGIENPAPVSPKKVTIETATDTIRPVAEKDVVGGEVVTGGALAPQIRQSPALVPVMTAPKQSITTQITGIPIDKNSLSNKNSLTQIMRAPQTTIETKESLPGIKQIEIEATAKKIDPYREPIN